MPTRVMIDPSIRIDVGRVDRDREVLIRQDFRLIADLLGRYAGRPPGSRQSNEQLPSEFVWEDENWRVGYTIKKERRWLFRVTTVITIRILLLKRVRH